MPFALHSERGPPTLPGQGHGIRDWARPKISDYTGALLTCSCPNIRARDVEMIVCFLFLFHCSGMNSKLSSLQLFAYGPTIECKFCPLDLA